MNKPAGTLEYEINPLDPNVQKIVDPFATDDVHGNRFGGAIPRGNLIEALFEPFAMAVGANAGRVRVTRLPVVAGELLTGLTVTLDQDSAGSMAGTLYIRIWNFANFAK